MLELSSHSCTSSSSSHKGKASNWLSILSSSAQFSLALSSSSNSLANLLSSVSFLIFENHDYDFPLISV